MKFFIAITLIVAVASVTAVRPLKSEITEIQEIIAAIQSPSTDPATAAALEQMLLAILGIKPGPVAVGPAIVDYEPISVGPAVIDFPLPDGDTVAEEPAIIPNPVIVAPSPSPADVAPAPAASTPLVQIILNVNEAAAKASPIAAGPAILPVIQPTPVHVVDAAAEPVHVVEVAPEPAKVVEEAPTPIQVVEVAPAPVKPVQIGVPILPEAAVILPEELN